MHRLSNCYLGPITKNLLFCQYNFRVRNVYISVSLSIYLAIYLLTNSFIDIYLSISILLLSPPGISLSLPYYIWIYHFILLTPLTHLSIFISLYHSHSLTILSYSITHSIFFTLFISFSQFISPSLSFPITLYINISLALYQSILPYHLQCAQLLEQT